jgi:hypothetical protein
MSDTSQVQIRIYEETVWGETPSTGNKMTDLNITNESLQGDVSTKKSAVIRSDANVKAIGRTSTGASGALGVELAYGEYDNIFAGLLRSSFGTTVAVTDTTISAVASGNHYLDSNSGFGDIQVGQWIKVEGFTGDPANNAFSKVLTASAGDITVAGPTLVDDAAGESVTVKGTLVKNGVTEKSFLIEKQLETSVFEYFTGMEASSAAFTFALDDFVNINIDFLGEAAARATSTQGDGSPTAASTNDSMNTIDSLSIYIDNALTTLDATAFNFTISPTLREKKALGNLGAIGIGAGTFSITGSIDVHNEDNSLLTDLDSFADKGLAIIVGDAAGNSYVFDFPSVKFTSGTRNTPGQDQDVLTSIGFEAQLDTDLDAMVGITRIPA